MTDSTSFKISDNLKEVYKGTGGNSANAAVKILPQYDILTGQIITCDVDKGASEYIQPKDLILRDLEFFKMEDLGYIDKCKAYYISKIKKYTIIYINEGKKYSQVNILERVKDLEPGQILDFPDVYIEANKEAEKYQLDGS